MLRIYNKTPAMLHISHPLRAEAEKVFCGCHAFLHAYHYADFGDVVSQYLLEKYSYLFPSRIRPTIRHLEVLLIPPRLLSKHPEAKLRSRFENVIKLWVSPLKALADDGFTNLKTIKVTFRVQKAFLERKPPKPTVDRGSLQRLAQSYVTESQIPATAVDIDWASMLKEC